MAFSCQRSTSGADQTAATGLLRKTESLAGSSCTTGRTWSSNGGTRPHGRFSRWRMCQASVDKGWNRATPQELVGILWSSGVLK